MNAELGRRFANLGRATIAVGMLWATPGAFEIPKNFGRNLQNPFSVSTAEAGELYSPLEQLAPAGLTALEKYPPIFENKDLDIIAKNMRDQGERGNFTWGIHNQPFRGNVTMENMITSFRNSFSR